jgi:peroxiredoxin
LLKKYMALILSIIALAAIIAAAYAVYSRYGGVTFSPPKLGAPVPDQAAGEEGPAGNDLSESSTVSGENSTDSREGGGESVDSRDSAGNGANEGGGESVDNRDSAGGGANAGSGESTGGSESAENDPADDSKVMVPDFTLKDLDGNKVSLSDYRDKIVILNFWATWCVYCGEEILGLNGLDRELQKAGDAVVLAVNAEEPYDKVREYITDKEIDLTVLLDEDGDVSTGIFGVVGFPTTFIVNKDGSLYAYIPGMIGIDTMRELIDKARNGKPLHDAN